MTASRLLLFTLTALAGIGAIYFWAIKVAAAAMGLLLLAVLLLVAYAFLRRGRS